MRLLCDRQELTEAFSVVAGIAPQKSTKPVLQNVKLRADDAGLTMFATDLQMSAKVVVEAVKVEAAGEMLLPAREMMALLRELGDPTLTLKAADHRCTIECGGGSFVLLGGDPDEFPAEAKLDAGRSLRLPAGRVADMMRKTVFAATREESRYAVSGVLWDVQQSCLRLVATDGRRLAFNYENLEDVDGRMRAIQPLAAVNSVLKVLAEADDQEVAVTFGESQIGFTVGQNVLVSRTVDQNFPEYESVIPKVAETTVEVSRSLLESNVRKVSVLTGGDVRQVRFTFSSSTLEMSAENSTVGRADVCIDVDVKGAGCTVAFNPDFVLDALRVADSDVVRIDLTDESTPAKFTLGESFTYVLMPISG
ncbi:MAG: DNA polymerase III subunit beta [Planctomycetota bacterium]